MKRKVEKKIDEALELLQNLKGGRETALVKTKLDEALLWLTKVQD